MMSKLPLIASKQSDWTKARLSPQDWAFSAAKERASSERSEAVICQSGRLFASARAMAPLPVPISKTDRELSGFSDKISSTSSSVSGLGINTRSSTLRLKPRKSLLPIIYWAGLWASSCSWIAFSWSRSFWLASARSLRTKSVKESILRAL